jgi:hypothetical protein
MKTTKLVFLLTAGAMISAKSSAAVVIDETTRNGGYESGTDAPWGGLSVTTDPSFAESGMNFATISGRRGDAFQFFVIQPTDGLEFTFDFWARIPTSDGFDTLSVSLLSGSGFTRSATVDQLASPPLESSNWQQYSYVFTIPSDWDSSGNTKLSIGFPNSSGTKTAYLDSVVLNQVPEPTTLALGLVSCSFLIGRRRRTRSSSNTTTKPANKACERDASQRLC